MSEPLEEQGGGEPERPDYLLERFQSVDDQARSYAELERSYTRGQQELRGLQEAYQDLASEISEMREQQYQEPQQQQYDPSNLAAAGQASPILGMLEQARESGDLQTELAIQAAMQRGLWEQWNREQAAQQGPNPNAEYEAERFALDTERLVRESVPDWDDIKGGVHDVIQSNEYLLSDTGSAIQAAGMVRNAVAIYRQQQAELAAQDGNQPPAPTAFGRQQKQAAQGIQGQGLNPGTEFSPEQYANFVRSQQLEGFKL